MLCLFPCIFDRNQHLCWTICAKDPSEKVQVRFEDFYLEGGPFFFDSIALYNGIYLFYDSTLFINKYILI